MLLTITTTYRPATDLGYLLHKHPQKVQSFPISCGQAHVFYPHASEDICTAALLLDIDPIGLVRNAKGSGGEGFLLKHYVNDRPYVASSFLSHAISRVYTSALNGNCHQRPELVKTPMPLEVTLSVLPCRGGPALLDRLFAPLGYTLQAVRHPLDPHFPEWGESPYYTVTLTNKLTLQRLLSHLYVLIPVFDNEKHYWVGQHEVEKLLEKGEGWLAAHPEKEFITRRYLRHIGSLTRQALSRLLDEETGILPDEEDALSSEDALETPLSLNQQRLSLVVEHLKQSGAKTVVDLGCGEGKLLQLLLKESQFEHTVGMDVSYTALEHAKDRLHYDDMPPKKQARLELVHGSLMYWDERLEGFDAAAVVEVIEHLDAARLQAFERILFECIRPQTIVLTTPNSEYNVMFQTLSTGALRHHDHRFEWTRQEFQKWSNSMAERYGYTVVFHPVGPEDESVGAPTQMGVFTLKQ
jgi:3' terminal RNA ribose 2'-O-methyltransferase Hen1